MPRIRVIDLETTGMTPESGEVVELGYADLIQEVDGTWLVDYTSRGFGNWFTDSAKAAGLPAGRTAHGLRKAAARRLAEAGCTSHQIAAITGHKTLKEVERYTRAAAQKALAGSAMDRVKGGTDDEQTCLTLPGSVRQSPL